MDITRLRDCLSDDFARLRVAADRDLRAPVPSCPEWMVEDLVQHVALVYLHKTECMRRGAGDETPWPPDPGEGSPLERLDRAYAALTAEFDARDPGAPSAGWYEPDLTVGFQIRRMAQETVIHRVDAELARPGGRTSPVPTDLALDGIDEVLDCFLCYSTRRWPDYFTDSLPAEREPPVLVAADEGRWLVRIAPDGARLQRAGGDPADAGAAVHAAPEPLLLWLWGRAADERVTVSGDQALMARLRSMLRIATQ